MEAVSRAQMYKEDKTYRFGLSKTNVMVLGAIEVVLVLNVMFTCARGIGLGLLRRNTGNRYLLAVPMSQTGP